MSNRASYSPKPPPTESEVTGPLLVKDEHAVSPTFISVVKKIRELQVSFFYSLYESKLRHKCSRDGEVFTEDGVSRNLHISIEIFSTFMYCSADHVVFRVDSVVYSIQHDHS